MQERSLPMTLSVNITKYVVASLSFLSFVVPFFIGHPQFIVGTIVNGALFASAILLPKKAFWPIIILPSLAVLSRGLIFGSFTPFLIYFLPFIWAGNIILIVTFQKIYPKINYGISVLIASLAKFCLLYLFAQIYFFFHLVPKLFLISMGVSQLLTALSGGILAYLILFYARRNSRG